MKPGHLNEILICAVLITGSIGPVFDLRAQTNTTGRAPTKTATPGTAQEEPSAERKARSLPYRGKLVSVDKQRSAITVGTRVFHVGAKTKIEKAGKPATLGDGVSGQIVTGSYRKLPDGTLEAVSVYFGGKSGGNSSGQTKAAKSSASKERE